MACLPSFPAFRRSVFNQPGRYAAFRCSDRETPAPTPRLAAECPADVAGRSRCGAQPPMMVRAEYAAALGDRYGIPMKKTGSDDGITTMVGSDRDGELGRFRGERRLWSAAAGLLVALGSTGAVVAAGIPSPSDSAKARQTFVSSSQPVASTLKLAIQHTADLVVSAGGFVAANPNASNRQFVQWANSVRALQRYPELFGLGHVVIVPAAKLAAFAARALRDPVTPLPADSVFTVLPPGHRSSYCLLAGAIYSSGSLSPPPRYGFWFPRPCS